MRLVLLIAAIVLFLIAAMLDFGIFDTSSPHVLGWTALGLTALAASLLPIPRW